MLVLILISETCWWVLSTQLAKDLAISNLGENNPRQERQMMNGWAMNPFWRKVCRLGVPSPIPLKAPQFQFKDILSLRLTAITKVIHFNILFKRVSVCDLFTRSAAAMLALSSAAHVWSPPFTLGLWRTALDEPDQLSHGPRFLANSKSSWRQHQQLKSRVEGRQGWSWRPSTNPRRWDDGPEKESMTMIKMDMDMEILNFNMFPDQAFEMPQRVGLQRHSYFTVDTDVL